MTAAPETAKTRLMIVEDEVIIATDLQARLQGLGFEVTACVTTGAEAVEAAAVDRPDLILMDIILSGKMDGIEAADIIRNQCGIPIVFVTAFADAKRLQKAKLTQPFGYLLKPFNDRELKIIVEMALYVAELDAGRVKAEKKLQNSEHRYRSLLDTFDEFYFENDLDGNFTFISPSVTKITGYSVDDFIELDFRTIVDEHTGRMLGAIGTQVIETGVPAKQVEVEIITKDGSKLPIELSYSLMRDQAGNKIGLYGLAREIVDQKKSEQNLQEIRETYTALFERSNDCVYIHDLKGNIQDVNPVIVELLGYSKEELTSMNAESLMSPDSLPFARKAMAGIQENGFYTEHSEYKWKCKNGELVYVKSYGSLLYRDGKPYGVLGVARNITEEKKTEEALKESEERNRRLVEFLPAGVLIYSGEEILFANDTLAKILGAENADQVQAKPVLDFIHPDHMDAARERLDIIKGDPNAILPPLQRKLLRLDGSEINVEFSTIPFQYQGRQVRLSVIQDITRQIETEKALRESEQKYRSYIDNSPDGVLVVDKTGRYLEVNDALCRMWGYSREELISQYIGHSVPPGGVQAGRDILKKAMAEGQASGEAPLYRKNGSRGYWYVDAVRLTDDLFLAFLKETTERKQAEELIQASLKEKELLLQEIHHRVKNNMQVISSLLSLQAGKVDSAETQEALNESQSRINAMALIHETLYQEGTFGQVDLETYVKRLTESLLYAYDTGVYRIDFKQDISDVTLSMDHAVPCGLVLNELISNSLKYAFPNGAQGEMSIKGRMLPGGVTELIIADNGVGLPENLDIKSLDSMGLPLVRSLVERQLMGSLTIDSDGGTKFTITFGPSGKKSKSA